MSELLNEGRNAKIFTAHFYGRAAAGMNFSILSKCTFMSLKKALSLIII